jgi:hypothetical protein
MRRGLALSIVLLLVSSLAAAGPAPAVAPPAPAATAPPAPATPATYDAAARGAVAISAADLQGLGWALTATCDAGDDVARRECRWVRDARLARSRDRTFAVAAERGAVVVGAWDPAAKSAPVTLRGCAGCGAPAVLAQVVRPFASEAEAVRWQSEVVPRLRAQLLVRVPDAGRRAGGAVALDVVGYRVIEPCSGEVVAASPASEPVAAEPAICGQVAEPPAQPVLPDQLSSAHVRAALAPAEKAAQACFETYGVAGAARFRISISDAGAVLSLAQDGDFVDTPTGTCIEAAVRAAVFPPTKRPRTTIAYPIVVR